MQQLPCVGVPHFEEMVVHSRDDCIVMAVPRYHGDFGFEVAFLFTHWFSAEKQKKNRWEKHAAALKTFCLLATQRNHQHLLQVTTSLSSTACPCLLTFINKTFLQLLAGRSYGSSFFKTCKQSCVTSNNMRLRDSNSSDLDRSLNTFHAFDTSKLNYFLFGETQIVQHRSLRNDSTLV